MDATRERRVILNDATLFGPGSKGEWAQFIGLILAITAVAALASTRLGYAQYDYAVGAAAILGGAFLALLVLGPSWIMLTVFLVFMIASHQFRSFIILPAGGVEWHPRELLLFVLLAHLGAKLVLGKAELRPDIMHYFFFLYCVFFAHIAARGLLTQTDIQSVIAECRFQGRFEETCPGSQRK